jgi:hypothetical protein
MSKECEICAGLGYTVEFEGGEEMTYGCGACHETGITPIWYGAPVWAKWHAEDGDGATYWFSNLPDADEEALAWERMTGHAMNSPYVGEDDGVMRLERIQKGDEDGR